MKVVKFASLFLLATLLWIAFSVIDFRRTFRFAKKFDTVEMMFYGTNQYYEKIPDIKIAISSNTQKLLREKKIAFSDLKFYQDSLVAKVYESRDYMPIWGSAVLSKTMLDLLQEADLEGLDANFYHQAALLEMQSEIAASQNPKADILAAYDMILTDAALTYAFHLANGKTNPQKIISSWNFLPRKFSADSVQLVQNYSPDTLRAAFQRLAPQNKSYRALQNRLKFFLKKQIWDSIPKNFTAKMRDKDSLILRAKNRLFAENYLKEKPLNAIFDSTFQTALMLFQHEHDLNSDGILDKKTVAAMNVSFEKRKNQIVANMERLRWTGNFPKDRIMVNIASFRLFLMREDSLSWTTKIIIGKPFTSTPVFTAEMTQIILNPTWTVPISIIQKEMLPKLKNNATAFLQSQNMEIINGKGEKINAGSVNWAKVKNNFPYMLRQRSGTGNSLGTIKFLLPNPHSVYLHDTPSKRLFAQDARAFSHGCVRVDKPYELAMRILNDSVNWNLEKIASKIRNGGTQSIRLKKNIPVFILYQTAGLEADGKFIFRHDIYNRDEEVIAAMKKQH